MTEDLVGHRLINDEGDHPHRAAARRAQQWVDLVNPFDQPRPAPPEGACITGLGTSRTGGRTGVRPKLPLLGFRLFPRDTLEYHP